MTLSGMVYICSAGETYDSVALNVYGDEIYAAELLMANPDKCRIPVFLGDEVLKLPVLEVPEEESGADYMPEVAPWKT